MLFLGHARVIDSVSFPSNKQDLVLLILFMFAFISLKSALLFMTPPCLGGLLSSSFSEVLWLLLGSLIFNPSSTLNASTPDYIL